MNILETNKFHIAVFDVGDKYIKCSILRRTSFRSEIEIVANHMVESHGFRNGYIVDLDKAEHSIKNVLYELETRLNVVIDECMVVVSSYLLESKYLDVTMKLNGSKILQTDIDDILKKSWHTIETYDQDMECIHCFPLHYILDEQFSKIQNPVGLVCDSMQVMLHALFVPKSIVSNLRQLFNQCDLNIIDFVSETWANSLGNLNDVYLDMGMISLELNYYRTNISVIKHKTILYSTTIDHSMYDMIQSVAMHLLIEPDEAEMVITALDDIIPHESNRYKHIEIKRANNQVMSIRQETVLNIMYNHIDTIIEKVQAVLNQSLTQEMDLNKLRIFLSGFGLNMTNIETYMEYNMHHKVTSVNDYALSDDLKKAQRYTSSLGVLRYLNNYDMINYKIKYHAARQGIWHTIRNWYNEISDL